MFGMSVKLVPGWLVAIAPRAIGVPVAATPGLVPHCEVLTALVLVLALAVGVLAGALLPVEVPVELSLLELELLQPAAAIAMAAARTTVLRAESIFAFISPPLRW